MELGWEKVPNWKCMFVHRKQGLFLSENVDDIKMAGVEKMMKHVDIDEPTSCLDHVYLGCTQRARKPNEIIVEQHTKMFESRIPAGATEKLPGWENLTHKRQRGPTTWKDMLKTALSGTVNRQTRKWSKVYKVSSPCLDDHQFLQGSNQLENCQKFARKLC